MAVLAGAKLYIQLLKVLSLISQLHCGLVGISRVDVAEAKLSYMGYGAPATWGTEIKNSCDAAEISLRLSELPFSPTLNPAH